MIRVEASEMSSLMLPSSVISKSWFPAGRMSVFAYVLVVVIVYLSPHTPQTIGLQPWLPVIPMGKDRTKKPTLCCLLSRPSKVTWKNIGSTCYPWFIRDIRSFS